MPQHLQKGLHHRGGIPFAIGRKQFGARPHSCQTPEYHVLALQVADTFRHYRHSDAGGDQTERGLNLHRALHDDGTKARLLAQADHVFRPAWTRMVRIKNERLASKCGQAHGRELRQAV